MGLGATGAGLNTEDRTAVVVGAGQQDFEFVGINFPIELGQFGIRLGLNGVLTRLRFGLAQFQQHQHIIDPLAEADQRLGLLLQRVGLFDDLLGRLLIVPEGVGSHLRLVLGEALGSLRQVDEPSQLSELGRDDVQMGPGDFEHKGRE